MLCVKVKIISNKKISQKYFKIGLEAPAIAKEALPGQFIMARLNNGYEPLLRRPFSIHRVKGQGLRVKGEIEILYEVVGEGTEILSQKKYGEYLDIIGPLGKGFDYPLPLTPYPLLVAGGMGVAPLVFLAEEIKKCQSVKVSKCQTLVLIGARTENQILCEKEFKNLGYNVKIATDDGSHGFKGRVTELLEKHLRSTKHEARSTIYACGPKPMLKEVAKISFEHKIPAQISLEEYMACGIGACLGCAVETKSGYQRVCREGPVFDTKELLL
ncbi:MAG: dihydroorotate dehydrogenase electron transfer subunit [Candidatus Omnitrophota bacterium]